MKKLIISLLLCLFLTPLAAFSNNNFIYSINVTRDNTPSNNVILDIKSDYKTDVKNKIDEMGREYFDIKDSSLKENFAVQYNNVNGVESVIAQQIGNKVRIYVTGNDVEDVIINFNNVENQPYPDKSAGYALLVFALVICALFRIFKKKATRLKAKARVIQNTASKTVYNNLMANKPELNKSSNKIYDNRSLTLSSLNRRRNITRPAISGKMNSNTIEAYQRMQQMRSKIAM